MKIIALLLSALLLPAGLRAADPAPAPVSTGPKIMIKVDDLKVGGSKRISAQWQRFADFIKERKIKVGIGIICESLEGDKPQYFEWIKDLQASGLVEFWLHAYEHKSWTGPDGVAHNEFAARTFEEQVAILAKCQQLASEKLGFTFRTFGPPGTGAPGPGFDENTCKALAADGHLQVILYPSPIDDMGLKLDAGGKVRVLDRVWKVNIERPTFKPNFPALQEGIEQNIGKRDYFVMQGHPQHWTDEGFADFVKMIDFLTAKGATFVTPSDYAATLPPPKPYTPSAGAPPAAAAPEGQSESESTPGKP